MPATTFDSAPIRTAIKNKIAGVANMGQVHNRERYAKERSALKALYESAAQTGNRCTAGSSRSAPSARRTSTSAGRSSTASGSSSPT
jgi:hypothetical protein